ncbi:pyruvate dehydrogenase e1 component subunit alpha, partial [Plakobranchus ocellatus]
KLDDEIKKEVAQAAELAKADSELPPEELFTSIYKDPPASMRVRGCDDTIWGATK